MNAHVHEATVRLDRGTDPAAVGAAVTVELCGAVEHEGPCPWPHNSAIAFDGDDAVFLTLVVASPAEVDEVRRRIALAMRSSDDWSVKSDAPRPLKIEEEALAARLAAGGGRAGYPIASP